MVKVFSRDGQVVGRRPLFRRSWIGKKVETWKAALVPGILPWEDLRVIVERVAGAVVPWRGP